MPSRKQRAARGGKRPKPARKGGAKVRARKKKAARPVAGRKPAKRKPAPKARPAPAAAAQPARARAENDQATPAAPMVSQAAAALAVKPPQDLAGYRLDERADGRNDSLGTFDVTVIGGGPGGSTLAALLAKQGRTVAVVERSEFPRFRIGESLLPFSIDIWEKTGVLPKIHQQGYCVKRGARFVIDETLEEECFWFRNGLDPNHPYAFQVQRGPFDKLLLDHARELGVAVFQPATATGWAVDAGGATLVTDRGSIRSQILCDVTGRWTFLSARQNQRRVHPAHRKITCYAHFTNVVRCEQDPNNIIIVRFGDTRMGWFWLIPFSDGTTSVGVVADATYYRQSGLTPHEFFWRSIQQSRSMAPRMRDAVACCDVLMEADFSYTSERQVGDRWLKVGDAGVFVDPIFSSGVFLSTKAAELAADAIGRAFAARDFREAMFLDYEHKIRQGTRVFWAFIDAFYNRDFLKQMVTSRRRPMLQSSITSLLAGDVFNDRNALITYLTGEGGAYADTEVKKLLG
ncbi:MAG: tryptophan 7-halogenase [Planctomycetes bacterium]|nr:tryptophan 7-halogenase [Planctomycetota bacterium]